ncbi:MAG TPA: hypothetical protein P5120_08435 [Spirochaetota bacterium]|nr:hypothetical protein [Spirochaetota bacterium]HRX47533.1 hypothetical protein [Spirochaetota bacterium]
MRIARLLLFIVFISAAVYGEDKEGSLGKIIAEIDNYKDKTVTLELRLKHLDRIFEKIVFYDSDNIDIEFDISGKERKKALARDLLNLHEGMLYSVTFRVIGSGNLGGLLGEIQGFKPIVIEIIPEKAAGSD